jgi:hypothetical protein
MDEIISYKMCAVKVRNAKLRNYLKSTLSSFSRLTNIMFLISASGWYLYIEASSPRQTNDKARLITPSIREAKSCLLFFYYMYGIDVGKLQVFIFIYVFIYFYLYIFIYLFIC